MPQMAANADLDGALRRQIEKIETDSGAKAVAVGVEAVQRSLRELKVSEGVEVKRGVEDELAFEKGIFSRVTADGLLRILLLLAEGKALSPTLSHKMMEILHAQEFNNGIPARLP